MQTIISLNHCLKESLRVGSVLPPSSSSRSPISFCVISSKSRDICVSTLDFLFELYVACYYCHLFTDLNVNDWKILELNDVPLPSKIKRQIQFLKMAGMLEKTKN